MRIKHIVFLMSLMFPLFILSSCSKGKTQDSALLNNVEDQIQKLNKTLTDAEKNDDLESFLAVYDENAISMPEYQPTLQGSREIKAFYQEIFQRQNIKTFEKEIEEVIQLDSTIIEIGTFTKEYAHQDADTLAVQNGKYWNVWGVQKNGILKLKGESFGYFHPIENPETLVVQVEKTKTLNPENATKANIPFELKAYNALMEKGVRIRDGALRSEFFTTDAKFMPFAEPSVSGIEKLKPYLVQYSSRGEVVIDSITCSTYHYESFDDYMLEYAQFKVKWIVPQYVGRTEGKGIRIWKRQEDHSLKLFREIGTHNHLD